MQNSSAGLSLPFQTTDKSTPISASDTTSQNSLMSQKCLPQGILP